MIDRVVLLDKAVTLGQVYGSKSDTVVYTQGVGLSARLRLEKLGFFTGAQYYAIDFYNELINERIDKENSEWRNDGRAGILWLDDLFEITKVEKYIKPIIYQADIFLNNSILDPIFKLKINFLFQQF